LNDFTPIGQITRSAYVLVTSPQSRFKAVGDFKPASQSGQQMSYASSGTGSAPHLAGALLASLLGQTFVHIPYQGGGPAMVGIIRGDVDMYFSSVAGARSFIESNQVRALAVERPANPGLARGTDRRGNRRRGIRDQWLVWDCRPGQPASRRHGKIEQGDRGYPARS
jgi:tripartite-type tricarboxylate transporter receptor subunit TctC